MTTPRPILARLLLAGVAVVLALAAAETVLRIAGYRYRALEIDAREGLAQTMRDDPADKRVTHAFEDDDFIFDPYLIWRPKPGHSVFNAQGYRGPELVTPKPPGEFRVLAVGDSNTLGWRRSYGANWPTYLGELLTETDPRIVTVNAGVWGYTLFQGARRLERALDLEPDLVLVCFGSNDAHPVAIADSRFSALHLGSLPAPLGSLRLAELGFGLWDRLAGAKGHAPSDDDRTSRVPIDDFRRLYRALTERSHERGFQLALLTRPWIGEDSRPDRWRTFAPAYLEATRAAAAELDLPLVDLHTLFRDRPELYKDPSHFTRLGHREAAKAIYDRLAPLVAEAAGVPLERLAPPGPTWGTAAEIDLGTDAAWDHAVEGFAAQSVAEGGRTALASRGRRSLVELLLDPAGGPYRLVIAGRAPGGAVEIEAAINGHGLGLQEMPKDWAVARWHVDAEALASGLNRVTITYPEASEGRRRYRAVQLDRVKLAPADPSGR